MRTLLRGGNVHEGTGHSAKTLDVVIEDDRIAALVPWGRTMEPVEETVDCSGKEVTPGFINVHSHMDFTLSNPEKRAMTECAVQGITTEVVGQCGQSVIPMKGEDQALVQDYMEYFMTPVGLRPRWGWTSHHEFAEMLESGGGVNANICVLVGHMNLRLLTMGYEPRPATRNEISAMSVLLREELEQGAFGLSSGLQWAPAWFAENAELIDLAKIVATYEGIYATHMRAEGDKVLEALDEAIWVAREASLPVHVSHLKAAGSQNWGKVRQALDAIDDERNRGVDIAPDKQPYTIENMGLRAILPPWVVVEAGGVDGLKEKLSSSAGRNEIKEEIEARKSVNWKDCIVDGIWSETGWDSLIIDGCPTTPQWERKSVRAIADEEGKDPWDIVFDLLSEGKEAPTAMFAFESEEDLRALYDYPYTACASDYFGKNHPRNWGTFPRFLGRLAQRSGWLSFEQALRRVTSLPAERCNIHNRGVLKEGGYADLVVLSRDELLDEGSYEDPSAPPSGIVHVLVNGKPVVRDGHLLKLDRRPGRVLRRGGD